MIGIGCAARAKRCAHMKAGSKCRTGPGNHFNSLLKNLRQVPADTIVLYLAFSGDGSGRTYAPADVVRSIAVASAAPVYGVLETYLGQGIVGGAFPSFEAHGKLAGEVALRVLAGEKPENIAVQPSPQAVASVDWRELRRWGINESRLPPGSVVRFRSPSVWEQYRWYIIGALAIITVQALLIVGLLLHRARRRRAETELRESQEIHGAVHQRRRTGPVGARFGAGRLLGQSAFAFSVWLRPKRCAPIRGHGWPHSSRRPGSSRC